MSFSADWLALRAEADSRARSRELEERLAASLPRDRALRVLDLGAGTGANLRHLSPMLPGQQHWRIVDNDPVLLAHVSLAEGVVVETVAADLLGDLEDLFDPAPDLVTASAFFDLAGAAVADRIVAATVTAGAVFLAVLSYDGREVWHPAHPLDEAVLAAFHADQRRDKGLGTALGPDATGHLARAFEAAGYSVAERPSDWVLEAPRDAALIAMLARGSADAVAPVLGGEAAADWHRARTEATRVIVGHRDLLALPGA